MAAKKKPFNWGAALGIGATVIGTAATVWSALQSRKPQIVIVTCDCGNELGQITNATPKGTLYHCDSCNLDYESN
jgi:hypothetical protein